MPTPLPLVKNTGPAGAIKASRVNAHRALAAGEAALLVITCGHLCFLPWALGTMHPWSQITSLVLAVAGCALALVSRHREAGSVLRQLLRHPVACAAGAWLAWMAVQAMNPAWTYFNDGQQWWLESRSHQAWLPSGVAAPFALSSPWRGFVVHAALLLLAASVWIGLRRRQSHLILLVGLSVNAFFLAALGLFQRWDGTARIFWMHWSSNDRFIASFIYPNHAGPYFYVMVAVATGLAWRFLRRTDRAPAGVMMALSAALCAVLVLHTQSRLSVTLLAGLVPMLAVALGVLARRSRATATRPWLRPAGVVLLAALVAVPLALPAAQRVRLRFQEAGAAGSALGADRLTAWRATAEMLADRPWLGHGAGCFRHVFPLYAQRHPAIYDTPNGVRRYWEHAHNDWLEYAAEMGALGLLPAVLGFGWLGLRLARSRFWRHPLPLALVLGCALPPVHAAADFVFQNPAVLFTWLVLLLSAIRLGEFDRMRNTAPSRADGLQPA